MIQLCENCDRLVAVEFSSTADPLQQLEHLESEITQVEARLQSEIARIEVQLEVLRRKRAPLKRQINSLFAPILQLPADITFQIFLERINDEWEHPTTLHLSGPLSFGRICSAWRDVTWSMPLLWSKVSVDLKWSCRADYCILLEEWLGVRSGDSPLSVRLAGEPKPTAGFLLVQTIARFSERWHEIDFHMPLHCFRALAGIQSRLPLLRWADLGGNWDRNLIQMFNVAPQLRAVGLHGLRLSQVDLPIAQLTTLEMPVYYFNECLDLFRSVDRLLTCVLNVRVPKWSRKSLNPAVAHQLELLELIMLDSEGRSISEFFDALSLPSVRTLKIDMHFALFPHTSFISLINRSSCSQLTRLSLSSIRISDTHLLQCLEAVPFLNTLELHFTETSRQTFHMLDPNYANCFAYAGQLLPGLEVFVCEEERLDVVPIVGMLGSRWDWIDTPSNDTIRRSRIQSAKFITARPCDGDPHARARLDQLIAEGMDVHFVHKVQRIS